MTRAFLFLSLHSIRNRLLSQLRRLKRPRYLIFALIGGGYFYLVAGRHWVDGFRFAGQMRHQAPPSDLIEAAAALFILASVIVAWCSPTPVSPLTFSEAEIHFLFPAPVSRRSLVQWKLLRGQVGVLVSLLIFTAVSGPYLATGSRLLFLAGGWVAFAAMQLHLTGIRMARHGLGRRGLGWAARAGLVMASVLAAVVVCGIWARAHLDAPEGSGLQEYAVRLLGSGPAWLLTFPARLLVRPALATDAAGFASALPFAMVLLLINYAWVLRSGVLLEEGALVAARRLAEAREAHTRGRVIRSSRLRATPAPFRLAPMGRPEVALVWKNLIGTLRSLGSLTILIWLIAMCILPALLILVVRGRGVDVLAQIMGIMCAVSALGLLLVGPSMLRSDFRQDLLHIDLLKTYPLSGLSLLMGTMMAPVVILTVIEWGLLAASALLMTSSFGETFPAGYGPVTLAFTAALLAPAMNLMSALIHNAAALLVPGWVALGPTRTTGVERIGQGMISTLGFTLALALSFLPAAIIFGVAWFLTSTVLDGTFALPLSALPAVIILSAEAWIGSLLLGAYLDRFDPSREFDALTPH